MRPGPEDPLAQALGWFSVGLGAAQVIAPGAVSRFVGVEPTDRTRALMRAMGVREIGAGAGILARPRPAGWLRARVAGDVLDLALLGTGVRGAASRLRLAAAAGAVVGVTALDLLANRRQDDRPQEEPMHGRTAATINAPRDEVYRRWRDLERLPEFMFHLRSVRVLDATRSHWTADGPGGTTVEWDAEIVQDVPGEVIAWRSTEGADVETSGSVRFADAPAGQGTEVLVEMGYAPPGGVLGDAVTKLFGRNPVQQMKDDVRRFKQVVETGEVLRSEGSPEGLTSTRQLTQREAQPIDLREGVNA